jgi:hypothetical protein
MMKRFFWIYVIAAASALSACSGADETTTSDGDQAGASVAQGDQTLLIDPCALVRCRAGTQCEVQQGHAVCVPMPAEAECKSDKECRAFSNYCDGCECLPLSASEPDPVCKGTPVACLVDPCRDAEARCVRGRCVLDAPAASF